MWQFTQINSNFGNKSHPNDSQDTEDIQRGIIDDLSCSHDDTISNTVELS